MERVDLFLNYLAYMNFKSKCASHLNRKITRVNAIVQQYFQCTLSLDLHLLSLSLLPPVNTSKSIAQYYIV